MPVALFDTATPLAPLHDEIDAAIARIIDSPRFRLGPEVSGFEHEFAADCGADAMPPRCRSGEMAGAVAA